MKFNQQLLSGLSKTTKGVIFLLSIKILLFSSFFLVQSCKKESSSFKGSEAKERFITKLNEQKKIIGETVLEKKGNRRGKFYEGNAANSTNFHNEVDNLSYFYLQIPESQIGLIDEGILATPTIQTISSIIQNNNAIIQYTQGNNSYQFGYSPNVINSNLVPLVEEAKLYLIDKGFTRDEITEMLNEEGVSEIELIPYVMILSSYEDGASYASNRIEKFDFSKLFFTEAIAGDLTRNDYIRCAIVAIGADAIYALGTSNAKTWKKAAMKKAFKAVAQRMLGPIGVSFAVITFGVCISEAWFHD